MREITSILKKFKDSRNELILAGDINIDLLKIDYKLIFNEIFDLFTSYSLFPKITLPTRISEFSATLIDNIFCKLSHYISESSLCVLTSAVSDHFPYFRMSKLYTNKRPYTVNSCMSQTDLDNFKLDVKKSDLPALFYKTNLNADPNTNLNIIQNVLTNAKRQIHRKKQSG